MKKTILIALRTTVVTLILTGILYPFAVTGLAQILFPWRANGSLVTNEQGQVVGSELIGQGFTHPAYFQPRPSAAGAKATMRQHPRVPISARPRRSSKIGWCKIWQRLKEENPAAPGPVPVELVTTSGSGLDPHLSPQAVLWQIPRVANARGITPERVKAAVEAAIEGRDLWLLGEPRVNVLLLNLALDRQFGRPVQEQTQRGK